MDHQDEPGDLPDPDAGAPYLIRVERRGRKWEAWVSAKGFTSFEGMGVKRHKARTREGTIARAQRECEQMEAADRARARDVVEYVPPPHET